MRYHDRFLSAATSKVSRRHTARFPAGKAWVAGLMMVALAALHEVVERVDPERPVHREAVVVGWSVAMLVVEVRPLRAA